jgi:TRAP-type C4-dicarboxylate transport system permease small subunit
LLSRWYERALVAGIALAGLMVLAMAAMVAVDVALRRLGWASLAWGVEVSEYLLYLSTFLGAPWVLRRGAHVRVDVITRGLPPSWAARIDRLAAAIGLAVCAVLVVYGARAAWEAYALDALIFKQLVIAEWWLLACIPLASVLLAVEFLLRLASPGSASFTPGATEGAVATPEDGL